MLLMTMVVACSNAAVDTEVLDVVKLLRLHLGTVTLPPLHSAMLTQDPEGPWAHGHDSSSLAHVYIRACADKATQDQGLVQPFSTYSTATSHPAPASHVLVFKTLVSR